MTKEHAAACLGIRNESTSLWRSGGVAEVCTKAAVLKSAYFQNTQNSPTCVIYNNSNIGFQLNFSIIKF
jgi:hypothetical protein